ncbi:MAG: hypothetical protein JO211_15590 [Acidobacteriaceae bacterium]|nr:hypothetical protein [Acidobacteriaceae bacterium]
MFALAANAMEWGNQGLTAYPGLLGWDLNSVVTPSGRKINGGIAIPCAEPAAGQGLH